MIKGFAFLRQASGLHVRTTGSFLPYTTQANFATFKEKLEKRQVEQGKQEFKKEMDFLANKPSFTLSDYKMRIIDGLGKLKKGIKAKLMSGNEQTEAALTTQKKILNSMYEDELLNEDKIRSEQKKEISMVSQTTVEDVNMLLKNYQQMKGIHKWLRKLKDAGEPIPADQDEMTYRYRKDRPISKGQIMNDYYKPTYSRKQGRQRMKWGPKKQV